MCESLAEGCDAIRNRKMNTAVGSQLLRVTAVVVTIPPSLS
jgi:hypothetical protein